SNAVKYDPHDEVEIDVECTKVLEEGQACWKVCISDRGYGIPDEKKKMLFQKYLRLKPDSNVPGTGLGLSIVKALVEKFSGNIWVEDRVTGHSDQGARFCVEIPAIRRPESGAE
ncbi:MAG: sensor histidine kinase, partial [Thermoplasmata archaeon]|nr:sensor histidine kinase [Thermoplasmata archaeon]